MCGIVGYLSSREQNQVRIYEKFFREALYIDTLRGFDSTGVMLVDNKHNVTVRKAAVPGPKFLVSKKFMELEMKGWAAIGHNRAATIGDIKHKNAHPFKFGPITLVHNGSLSDDGRSLKNQLDSAEVDSALIAYNLSKVPPENAKDVIEILRGSFALVWSDERDKSVNMVRNMSRPLHFGLNPSGNSMFFMSDGHMLNMLANRDSMSTITIDDIFQLTPLRLLKFKFGSMVPEVTEIVPFRQWQQGRRVAGMAGGGNRQRTYPQQRTSQRAGETRSKTSKKGSKDHPDHLPEYATGPNVVKIGNVTMMIPPTQRKALKWFDLKPTDELSFMPLLHESYPDSTRGIVYGTIYHPGYKDDWDAIIHGVEKSQFKAFQAETWQTWPLGCNFHMPETDDGQPVLIMKVKAYTTPLGLIKAKDDYVPEYVLGPRGQYISLDEWEELVKEGCLWCNTKFTKQEHEEIFWDSDAEDLEYVPMCKVCADQVTAPDKETKH